MPTPTFEELRERNNRALGKAEAALQSVQMSTARRRDEQIEAARQRIEQILVERARLEDLASAQNQRAAYGKSHGAQQWHEDFIMLREVLGDTDRETERSRAALLRAQPASKGSHFQATFAPRHHYACPRDGGPSARDDGIVDHVLVSADRISDALAKSLHLVEFTDGDAPLDRLGKKRDAIPALKAIWNAAQPLRQRHYRILVVSSGAPPETTGSLLYTRDEPAAQNGKMVQFFPTAYAAHRKTIHEHNTYVKEVGTVTDVERKLQAFLERLDREWKRDTPTDEKMQLRQQAVEIFAECQLTLRNCVNHFKVEARETLSQMGSLTVARKDTGQEVVNPSAAMTRIVKTVGRIRLRFEEMCGKGGYNEQDQMALLREIERSEGVLDRFRESVRSVAQWVERTGERLAPFGKGKLSPAQLEAQAGGLQQRILRELHSEELSTLRVRPFRTYAQAMLGQVQRLPEVLRTRRLEELQQWLVRLHILGKFFAVQQCFEGMNRTMAEHPEGVAVGRVRQFVINLRAHYDRRQLFPEITVPKAEDRYLKIREELPRLDGGLHYYQERNGEVPPDAAVYERLRDYLDRFDPEGIVRSLSV